MADGTSLSRGCGLVVRTSRSVVRVTGKDRLDYLQRMTTQDLRGLSDGKATRACVLDVRGRVLGDPVVQDWGDCLVLEMDRLAAGKAMPALERFVIADDVAFADASDAVARLDLVGPRAPEVLAAAGLPVPGPWEVRTGRLGAPVHLLRRDLGPRPCFEAILPRDALAATRDALRRAGAEEATEPDLEVARVEEGVPAYGSEVDDQVMPTEAGLESAVSFSKGCFPGQEPVVMAKHRGHPATLLVRLRLDAAGPPPPGTTLLDAGRVVGRVTSSVRGASVPGVVGLGLVRYTAARAGAAFDLPSGGRAEVTHVGGPN